VAARGARATGRASVAHWLAVSCDGSRPHDSELFAGDARARLCRGQEPQHRVPLVGGQERAVGAIRGRAGPRRRRCHRYGGNAGDPGSKTGNIDDSHRLCSRRSADRKGAREQSGTPRWQCDRPCADHGRYQVARDLEGDRPRNFPSGFRLRPQHPPRALRRGLAEWGSGPLTQAQGRPAARHSQQSR
jgi:hypothetical protein